MNSSIQGQPLVNMLAFLLQPYFRYERWYNTNAAQVMPPFYISLLMCVVMAHIHNTEFTAGLTTTLAVIVLTSWVIAKFKPLSRAINRNPLVGVVLYAPWAWMLGSPAMAQLQSGDACAGSGIFNPVAEFTVSIFANFGIASSNGGIGALPQFICGLLGFMIIAVILGFLAVGIMCAIKISNGNLSDIINPIVGLGFFVLFVTVAISFLIGAN